MTSVITTQNLTKELYGEFPVTLLQNVNISVNEGEFVAIMGPAGSGKSSLMYLLGLLDSPTKGNILLANNDTNKYSEQELSKERLEKIGFVFQFHFLLMEFTLLQNVMLPMQKLGKLSTQEMKERATTLLSQFGLAEHINKLPSQVSGGQRQRAAIARALANDPLLILADEPTGNLDSKSSKVVIETLKRLTKEFGKTVVVVTHDPNFASEVDRVIKIIDGKVENND